MENFLDKEMSYIYGWMLSDGTLSESTRNRGKLSSEISVKDIDILEKMKNVLQEHNISSTLTFRTRTTPFKKDFEAVKLSVFSLETRNTFKELGFPVGKKSDIVTPPNGLFSENDFCRGFIDGDGSIGIAKQRNYPFVSVVISSDPLYDYFSEKVNDVCGYLPNINRNKRDNVYNLGINRKNCILFLNWLDYSRLSLKRKQDKAKYILENYSNMY